jgi:hypothetical protein
MTRQGLPLSDAANDDFFFHSGPSVTRIGRGPEPVRRAGYARFLRTCGFVAVDFDYRGDQGAGRWVSARVLDADEGEHGLPAEFGLREWCARYFGELLIRRYPNWKESQGSCGMFTWQLRDDRVIHTHFPGGTLDGGALQIES